VSEHAIGILAEMRHNAVKARSHAARGGADWHHDELVVDAVANRVRQVAELAKHGFPADEKEDYPQIPWDLLARARDFYTHHYARLDPAQLRETVDAALPALIDAVEALRIPELTEDEPPHRAG